MSTETNRSRFAGDNGSLPLVLLVAIVIGGLVAVLFASTRTGVEVARQDRDWHAAIQVADAGVQQGLVLVRAGTLDATCPGRVCEGKVADQGTYRATYQPIACGLEVRSEGTFGGRTRTAVGEICRTSLVGEAGIVGLTEVRVAGAFQSAAGTVLGTAGGWNFSGVAPCGNLGGLEAYDPNVPDACGFTPNISDREFPDVAGAAFQPPADSDVGPVGGECWNDGADSVVSMITEFPTAAPSNGIDRSGDGDSIYCVNKVNFTSDWSPPPDQTFRVFVSPGPSTGSVSVNQNANTDVNWSGGSAGEPTELQIYVTTGRVEIGAGNPNFAGFVWALDSYCQMKGTPEVYGAMICDTADMRGNFTRADELNDLLFGSVEVARWYEPFE